MKDDMTRGGARDPQRLNPTDRSLRADLLVRHHDRKESLAEIARHYHVSVVDLTRHMRRLGVEVRRQPVK